MNLEPIANFGLKQLDTAGYYLSRYGITDQVNRHNLIAIVMTEKEKLNTAYHESGHAIIGLVMPEHDPVYKVTIIPRGAAGGATFSLPEKDRHGYGRKYIEATLRVLCGGRIAEEKKTGDTSSGASMDIKMATQYARAMVLEWGMSDRVGFVNHAGSDQREMMLPEKDYSEQTARIIDEEIRKIVAAAYDDCTRLIDTHWDQLVAVAEALLKYETLSSNDVDQLMKGERIEKPTVAELLSAEAAKSTLPPPSAKPAAEPGDDLPGIMPSPA